MLASSTSVQLLVTWFTEYDEHWWIGCVLESNPEKREVTMNFPHGPHQFFSFRDPPDIFTVDLNDPLLAVDPKLTTGQSYFITSKESVNFILHSVL